MYLIEYVHLKKKKESKECSLFYDFTEFTQFALNLSLCSNIKNIECFEVEFSKKENIKTLNEITKPVFEKSMSNLAYIRESVINAKQ